MLSEIGFKVFRMSISWSRIFPKGDEQEPNKAGLEFYRNVFKELHKYGIEPLVSISHYDDPLYISEKYHDWSYRNMIDLYVHFATTVFKEYKDLVRYWITFNEINSPLLMLTFDDDATDKDYQHAYQKLHYQFVASARAVKVAHEINPENVVANMICGTTNYPATPDPKDILLTRHKWEQLIYYASDGQIFVVDYVPIYDPAEISAVTEAYLKKYHGQYPIDMMVSDKCADATVELRLK
ncbi:hypothetical protein CXB72_05615 [Lactobacillus acidophilus]|nr:hypothetical protein CXB72_05615 [Lactobacillus acidophilus]